MQIKRKTDEKSALISIWTEIAKSVVVVMLIVGLGTWQFDFAYRSVLSHP